MLKRIVIADRFKIAPFKWLLARMLLIMRPKCWYLLSLRRARDGANQYNLNHFTYPELSHRLIIIYDKVLW